MESQNIIQLVREQQYDRVLDKLYKNFPAFKNAFVKSGGKRKDAEDIFQDALLVFIEKAGNTDFELSCSVHTYLYSICHNLSLVYFKKKSKNILSSLETDADYTGDGSVRDFIEEEKKYKVLDETLQKVGKKCLEILTLFYLKNLRMAEVAKRMGLKSETSAKTRKYKCLEKAKKLSLSVLSKNEQL